MNLLLTLNKKYLKYMISLLKSIDESNKANFDVFVISNDVNLSDIEAYSNKYLTSNKFNFIIVRIKDELFANAPITNRYPLTVYYRIFASKMLPDNIDRILYLDPDIIVLKDLSSLYNMDFDNNYYIATTNVKELLRKFNEIKNKAPKGAPYPNSGVMMMNLKLLREQQDLSFVYTYINQNSEKFVLPDQDIFHGLYGDKIKIIDHIYYNLSDRGIKFYNLSNPLKKITLPWVEKNCYIVHYYGKNKPWNKNYHGILDVFYHKYAIDDKTD